MGEQERRSMADRSKGIGAASSRCRRAVADPVGGDGALRDTSRR